MSTLLVLWDDASLWGLLVARALKAYGLPHRFVRGHEVQNGILSRLDASLFMVPGGSAKAKAVSLGHKGSDAIRNFVREGGHYIGVCGGAGLALNWHNGDEIAGLGLCPWGRGAFDDRLQHFMSGHLHVSLACGRQEKTREDACLAPQCPAEQRGEVCEREGTTQCKKLSEFGSSLLPPYSLGPEEEALLPVWWPGRFEQEETPEVEVLARYSGPGPDFWLTDLPISSLPPNTFEIWNNLYGISVTPTFLEGQPCVIRGNYGKGSYLISYSHLETPDSPFANAWLAHLFRTLAGLEPVIDVTPPWDMAAEPVLWDDSDLAFVEECLAAVAAVGLEHGIFFQRNEWLLGWRAGIPGANVNSLLATIRVIRRTVPCEESKVYWQTIREKIISAAEFFRQAGTEYLLSERLSQTLTKILPDTVPQYVLRDQRNALFGPPMQAGGVFLSLLGPLDHLAFLQLRHQG